MTTDEDIKKLKIVFATKEDLERGLGETRKELRETTGRLAEAIVKTQAELQEVKENMVTKIEFNQMLERLDWIVGEIKENREERLFHRREHDHLREEIDEIKRVPVIAHAIKN